MGKSRTNRVRGRVQAAENRDRFLAYSKSIRDLLLDEVRTAPILKTNFYQRLEEYDTLFGRALAFIELGADDKKKPWYAACKKARETIYEGIKEETIDNRVYFKLDSE